MSKKTDITELAELPLEEIEERIQLAAGRVEQRIQRAQTEERDLTEREGRSVLRRQDRIVGVEGCVAVALPQRRVRRADEIGAG